MTESRDTSALATPDFVVLGMIHLGARTGYDIKKTVGQSIRFFWTISEAQIYPSLSRLEQIGLVVGRSEATGKRRRRTFALTDNGEDALRTWLLATEPMPFELRDVGLVRLFFAEALAPADARALLLAVQRRSEMRVAMLEAITPDARRASSSDENYPLLTLRIGIAFHQAMIAVCKAFGREMDATVSQEEPISGL